MSLAPSSIASGSTRKEAHARVIADRRVALHREIEASLKDAALLTCEIGSGHGHFLTAYAAHHVDRTCVGVDIVDDRVARANRKRDRAQLPNLHFFHADARLFLETLPSRTMLRDVFILFPDPWPKKRHHKNRLLQAEFLDLLRAKTVETARLYFRTDHSSYFESARGVVEHHSGWQLSPSPWPFEHVTVFQSRAAHYFSFCAEWRS